MLITAGILILVVALGLGSLLYVTHKMLSPVLDKVRYWLAEGCQSASLALSSRVRYVACMDLMRQAPNGPYRQHEILCGNLLENIEIHAERYANHAARAVRMLGCAFASVALVVAGVLVMNELITPSTGLLAKGVLLFGFARISYRLMMA